ncbi:dihydropteroate synthase [Methanocorpusculum sp. MG]|uniref:dihydropteroate synthase n=1 Tax=Methanocorpusculum petauri TaxID=3002863 RepID=A0ABT4IGQ9_9EURY|nr:dihydropteroate synthase [Methanocorpusculum petauri]MCZ0860370.1 dihydropteroate synthase [Methanocorpusculum petauri]MDE2444008.1 dihydropteroate synthase [Methanocorpusculum sp.]
MEVRIKNVCVGGGSSPKIMGVLNISPESFFSDSFIPCDQVVTRVEEMIREGADVIDLGARSTALNAPPLTVADERERVLTAMKELDGYGAVLSLDTMYPEVLDAALHYDLAAINDINGLGNPEYAQLAADSGLPVIAMAAHKLPGDPLDMTGTHAAMQEILDRAGKYGICDLILDPGVGKWVSGRSLAADWDLCRQFSELKQYDCPLLAAVSRKTFIGDCIGKPAHERLYGTLGVLFYLLENGADIVRVHDVGASRDVARVFEQLCR